MLYGATLEIPLRGISLCLTHSLAVEESNFSGISGLESPLLVFSVRQNVFGILLIATTTFLAEVKVTKASPLWAPETHGAFTARYGFPDEWMHQYAINMSVSH